VQKYLQATEIIDYSNKEVYALAEVLSEPMEEVMIALKNNGCYEEMVANFPDIREDL
jgi:hypothetical protein